MYPGRLEELKAAREAWINKSVYAGIGSPTFLPVILTGGIGDSLLCLPTLKALSVLGYTPFIVSKHAEAIHYFKGFGFVAHKESPSFTWRLELDSVARFRFENGFDGFEMIEHKRLFEQQRAYFSSRPDLEYLIEKHPRDKHVLAKKAQELGVSVQDMPLLSLGFGQREKWERVPPGRKGPAEDYITIHDGYDANYQVSGRATKTWKWEFWNELVRRIKGHYPGMAIIQVGAKTSRLIDGVHNQTVNKTTLTQAFDILSRSRLHIDTDSGMVHAATLLGVPCVVMFGPTPASFYGHPQNINLSNETSCSGRCFHLTRNWMDKCPVGYDSPRCMDDISVDQVMSGVFKALDKRYTNEGLTSHGS